MFLSSLHETDSTFDRRSFKAVLMFFLHSSDQVFLYWSAVL